MGQNFFMVTFVIFFPNTASSSSSFSIMCSGFSMRVGSLTTITKVSGRQLSAAKIWLQFILSIKNHQSLITNIDRILIKSIAYYILPWSMVYIWTVAYLSMQAKIISWFEEYINTWDIAVNASISNIYWFLIDRVLMPDIKDT